MITIPTNTANKAPELTVKSGKNGSKRIEVANNYFYCFLLYFCFTQLSLPYLINTLSLLKINSIPNTTQTSQTQKSKIINDDPYTIRQSAGSAAGTDSPAAFLPLTSSSCNLAVSSSTWPSVTSLSTISARTHASHSLQAAVWSAF